MDTRLAYVALKGVPDHLRVGLPDRAEDLRGDPGDERSWRDLGAGRDHGPGSDYGAGAYLRALKQYGAPPNQDAVLYSSPVYDSPGPTVTLSPRTAG